MRDKNDILEEFDSMLEHADLHVTERNLLNRVRAVILFQKDAIEKLESESEMQIVIDHLEGRLAAANRLIAALNNEIPIIT